MKALAFPGLLGGSLLLCSCAALTPREEPASALKLNVAEPNTPSWASDRIAPRWWKQYHDSSLTCDIEIAFSESPDLQVIAARLEQADAQVRAARASFLPNLNLGYGFRFGRAKDMDFGPYDLKPWTGSAMLNWEVDIFGKLQRARESAEFNRRAVFWDLSAAKLVLATRIAESRFRIYRLREEIDILSEAVEANGEILHILRDREKAGLIAMTEVHRATAEDEKLNRSKEELSRLSLLAEVELDTLRGGFERGCDAVGSLPAVPPIPGKSFSELVCCHPSLLAAESKVRSAFRLEEVARLDLLPSFTLTGSLMGASPHFFLDQFAMWRREIGPSLDIPIYDPVRLATIDSRRGKTNEAVAEYRSALVQVVGEVDAAYINLRSRRNQLERISREVRELASARKNVIANFKAGLVSQVEVLESERSYLQASRTRVVLEEAVVLDHVALIRALGGACSEECLPVITAQRVIIATPVESLLTVKAPREKNRTLNINRSKR